LAVSADEAELGPGGLAGWLALRRTPAYAIERRHRERKPFREHWRFLLALVCVAAGFCTLCACGFARLLESRNLALWTGVAALGLCLLMLARAGLAGLRAFAGERARNTLDALRLTPLAQREVVRARLALALGPHLIFCAVIAGALLAGALMHRSFGCWQYATVGALVCGAALGFLYFSLTVLMSCLGLALGLRIESPARALAVVSALGVATVLVELGLAALGAWLLTSNDPGEILEYATYGYVAEGLVPSFLALGTANLFVARGLLGRTVRRFEDWAAGELTGEEVWA
jgi:predicted membrane protein